MDVGDCWWHESYIACLEQDDDSAQFHVLAPPTVLAQQPLLIWVHPGDAVEDRSAFDASSEGEACYQTSLAFQEAMGQEILDRLFTHQVVVLHRQSSAYAFDQGHAIKRYADAMGAVQEQEETVHLYGDDLVSAAQWLLDTLALKDRPSIFLTGAYSDREHGCLTAIGRAIEQAGVGSLEVSQHAPSDPGSVATRWTPCARRSPARPRGLR